MAEYEKVTPAKFRVRLKDDQYKNLTGARRAIGRMSEWSDGQKTRARNEAEKHFEGASASPKKPVTKKATTKKTTKVAKKVVAKKTKSKKGGALARQNQRNKAKAVAKKAKTPAPIVNEEFNLVQRANLKVGTIAQALESMRVANSLGASETDVAKGAKTAQHALTKIVEDLCGVVAQGQLSEEEQVEAEKLAKAAAAGANGAGYIAPSSPGLPAPAAVPPQPEA